MRKIFILLSILLLSSCSKDDEKLSILNTSEVLLKKIQDFDNGSWQDDWVFYYDGKKILYIDSEFYRYDFYYNGDKIVRYTQKQKSTNNIYEDNIYNYDGNSRLIEYKCLNPQSNYASKHVYEYLNNGTVKDSRYTGNLVSQSSFSKSSIYTFQNSLLINQKDESILGYNYEDIYEYSEVFNPMRNVTGIDKIFVTSFGVLDEYFMFGTNHINKRTSKSFNGSTLISTSGMNYNCLELKDNFPTEVKEVRFTGVENEHYKLIYN